MKSNWILAGFAVASLLCSVVSVEAEPTKGGVSECGCMAEKGLAAFAPKETKGPGRRLLKGLGSELETSLKDSGKDMVLIFSVQDMDPYGMPKKPPKNQPYSIGEVQLVDGSTASIYRYPDNSMSVSGGFADGTYACPSEGGILKVYYPNGAHGTLKFLPGGGYEIHRSDDSVTTVTKTASGSFRVSNDKIGFMGEMRKGDSDADYQFAKKWDF